MPQGSNSLQYYTLRLMWTDFYETHGLLQNACVFLADVLNGQHYSKCQKKCNTTIACSVKRARGTCNHRSRTHRPQQMCFFRFRVALRIGDKTWNLRRIGDYRKRTGSSSETIPTQRGVNMHPLNISHWWTRSLIHFLFEKSVSAKKTKKKILGKKIFFYKIVGKS